MLGPELQCLLRVKENLHVSYVLIFQDANNLFKIVNFSEDHNDIYDLKHYIDPGNLFSIYIAC